MAKSVAQEFRWAILSNTTVSPLLGRLSKLLQKSGREQTFYCVEHGAMTREALSDGSPLYQFRPDLIVLLLDPGQIVPDLEFSFCLEPAERQEQMLRMLEEHTGSLLRALRSQTRAPILLNSFSMPGRTVHGIGLDRVLRSALRDVNGRVEKLAKELSSCYLYDLDQLWMEVGLVQRDRRFEMIAQLPFGPIMQQALVEEWGRYYRALQGSGRKCVVVDLDNTLWGGIIGEDGPAGLRMGDTPEGRPYHRLQKSLKALGRRGVLLAVNSKNNLADAMEVIRNHPEMLLREQDFASMRINWEDKASNLASLAKELNIGLQHMVFLDDNPTERDWVRSQHPEVLVPELPADASYYADVLTRCELDSLVLTDEDLKRGQLYYEDRQRRAFQESVPSFDAFLAQLEVQVRLERVQPLLLDRAVQLCQRTNQFNLTTRRYNLEEIKALAEGNDSLVVLMHVRDRFGEYGWTGLVVARQAGAQVTIDAFLLSCRVLGKNVEFALLQAVVQWAKGKQASLLQGIYIATPKNTPCRDFYERASFRRNGSSSDGEQVFEAGLAELPRYPIDHIKTITNL